MVKPYFLIYSFLPTFLHWAFQPLISLQTRFAMIGARQPSGHNYKLYGECPNTLWAEPNGVIINKDWWATMYPRAHFVASYGYISKSSQSVTTNELFGLNHQSTNWKFDQSWVSQVFKQVASTLLFQHLLKEVRSAKKVSTERNQNAKVQERGCSKMNLVWRV